MLKELLKRLGFWQEVWLVPGCKDTHMASIGNFIDCGCGTEHGFELTGSSCKHVYPSEAHALDSGARQE